MLQYLLKPVNLLIISFAVIMSGCEKGPNFKTYTYPAQTVASMSPNNGYPKTYVTITGKNFGTLPQAVKVYFGGVLSDSISCIDNQIIARVPANAVSGKVTLQVWTTTNDSIGSFTVIPAPVIKTVNPTAAAYGDTIKLSGSGFGTNLSTLKASFNGTPATIYSVTADTVIKVIAPTGFTSGPDTLFVNGYPVLFPSNIAYLVGVPTPTVLLSFDGNLNVAGTNPNGISATYIQGAGSALSYITGVKGQAVWLNGYANATWGINQAISLTPATAAQYNELTIACWVQYPGGATNATNGEWIFSQALSRGNTLNLQTAVGWPKVNGNTLAGAVNFEPGSAGSYGTAITNAGFTTYSSYGFWTGASIPTTGWHHVCMTLSQTNHSAKFYLDGILVSNTTYFSGFGGTSQSYSLPSGYDLTLYTPNRCYIGSEAYGSNNEPSFNGGIDEFQIYNSALSGAQVYTLYYKKQ